MDSNIWHKRTFCDRVRLTDTESRLAAAEGQEWGGLGWSLGPRCKVWHLEWINSTVLLGSPGSYSHYPVISRNG